jgi:hypothetical protein
MFSAFAEIEPQLRANVSDGFGCQLASLDGGYVSVKILH